MGPIDSVQYLVGCKVRVSTNAAVVRDIRTVVAVACWDVANTSWHFSCTHKTMLHGTGPARQRLYAHKHKRLPATQCILRGLPTAQPNQRPTDQPKNAFVGARCNSHVGPCLTGHRSCAHDRKALVCRFPLGKGWHGVARGPHDTNAGIDPGDSPLNWLMLKLTRVNSLAFKKQFTIASTDYL